MVRTAIQLFTLRDLETGTDPTELLARVGDTAFDGVEFYDAHFDALTDDGTARRTAEVLEENGLETVAAHVGIERVESDLEAVVGICETIGCSTLVIPTYDRETFETVAGIEAAADRIAEAAGVLEGHGIDLRYHNHTFEFDEVEGRVAFERFVEAAGGRFGFEPDVGLAAHAGYAPLKLLALVAEAAPVVHLTDTVPGDDETLHADVGEGVVDLDTCVDAAVDAGTDWFVCENGRTTDATASLEHGNEAFASFRERANRGRGQTDTLPGRMRSGDGR